MTIYEFERNLDNLRHAIKFKYNSLLNQTYGRTGLTHLQGVAVVYVAKRGQVTVSELGRRLCMANSNISTMCKRLEQEGYLTRSRSKDDERTVYLSPTQKATAFNRMREATLYQSYTGLLENNPNAQADMEDIIKGFEKLDKMLTLICQKENIVSP